MFGLPTEHYVCNDCQVEWFGDGDNTCCECDSKNIEKVRTNKSKERL